ncbi:molybdopterin molybdotransferase MoeA [Segnochrobactrum spirostomi]|uniref:Molybdopterin molybdenumtransferase n=1 Tax=Segnochrobactrum spirostomi TaxID=2608987 RepID=A0A6A7Y092_9HYPH|nr:gephyrin-like molybdotransferase Glp [Segnochrobactrum spirostomi]MQT11918.1 molybdopterin molybdotransferase MoeA [Segnochrobactrum spirostomi]
MSSDTTAPSSAPAKTGASPLLPVDEALARVLAGAGPCGHESVPLVEAAERVLASDLKARRRQPPFDASAMDGYAVRATDAAEAPARLAVIGEAIAGRRFDGTVGPGQAVRIFTGAPVPQGADAVLIQENAERHDGGEIAALEPVRPGQHVRRAGFDFEEGQILLTAGRRLDFRALSLAAAMNHPVVPVVRRPKVAILSTGSELVPPGTIPGPDEIVASNHLGIAALVTANGGITLPLGIAEDDIGTIAARIREAIESEADVLVTLGGASVGDHDLVAAALKSENVKLDFWKIAMRPGKPMMFGTVGGLRVLGLPGNPVSSLIGGFLFLAPLVAALAGRGAAAPVPEEGRLSTAIKANDTRRDYLRARLSRDADGVAVVTPLGVQDSSMMSAMVEADALLIREPFAPAAEAGAPCRFLRL